VHREHLAIAWPAVLSVVGLVTIGVVLAKIAPSQWQACEMLLCAAVAALIWETFRSVDRSSASRPNRDAWFGNSVEHEFTSDEYRPWDVEQAISRLRVGDSRPAPFVIPVRVNRQSVEQIASEALTHAFRR
jgi:hypothetical protein